MIVIVAAVSAETDLLRQSLSPCEVRRCGARELFLGSLFGKKVALLHSGIGKINAASAVTALLETFEPEAVIVTGCAGAYPQSGLQVGDLVLASEEILADEEFLRRKGLSTSRPWASRCWSMADRSWNSAFLPTHDSWLRPDHSSKTPPVPPAPE